MVTNLKRRATEYKEVSPPPTKRKVNTTTTKSAVSNFFKPASQKDQPKTQWTSFDDSVLICRYDKPDLHVQKPRRIAAFDLDSTLISTASGKRFAAESHDWKWWHTVVEGTLQKVVEDGFLIVVFSNQARVNVKSDPKKLVSDDARRNSWKTKVNAILSALDLPITVYAATQHDEYRKPRPGMWRHMLSDQALSTPGDVDLTGSFFVGDAAGRMSSPERTKDFSCSDRDLAANVGITFYTPEEYFLKEDPLPFARSFDPTAYLASQPASQSLTFAKKSPLELVLHVGSPGAGKSTFYWTYLEPLGYKRVNQDILKSRDKCIAVARDHLEAKQSVVVDNTNADIDVRSHWVKLAKVFDVPVRCVLFTASALLCEHNSTVRALAGSTMNPESRALLPKIAFTSFVKRYTEPTLEEGFEDIIRVPFILTGDDEQKALWSKYWL